MTSPFELLRQVPDDAPQVKAITIGDVGARGLREPDRYVYVPGERLRLDVVRYWSDAHCFEAAIRWLNWIVVGYGSHVHLVSLRDHSSRSIELGSYFGYLNPTENYLLVATGERVLRLEPSGDVLWTSDILAVDGVVLHELGPSRILGDAEWDPPGDWRPFALDALTGRNVPLEAG